MNKTLKENCEMKDSGIEWLGEIPKSWEIKRLRYLVNIKTGSNDTIDSVADGAYPFYVRSPKIERINTYTYDGEAILMAGDGVGAGKVFHYVNGKFACHQRVYNLHQLKDINGKFLYYYLKENFSKEVEKGTAKSTVDSIRLPMIKDFTIVLPPLYEQQVIVDYLDKQVGKIDELIVEQKEAVENWKAYNQSLITEAVTKGLNPNAEMKDSGIEWIGEVPSEWEVKKLRYLGSCKNGISKGAEYFGYGYPFVSYGDVYQNFSIPIQVEGLIDSTEEERNLYSVEEGDIFFTRTSETKEEVGLTSVCLETIPNATFTGFVIRFRPRKGILNKNYAKYYFRGEKHRAFFIKEMNVTTRASLGQGLLKNLPVLIPPLLEQQAIADFLDEKCSKIDQTIGQKQVLIKQLEEYKQSLIYECVTGKRCVL